MSRNIPCQYFDKPNRCSHPTATTFFRGKLPCILCMNDPRIHSCKYQTIHSNPLPPAKGR